MIVRFDARQQRRDRDGAISHVLLVGHIIFDGQGLYLRVLEQLLGLPGDGLRPAADPAVRQTRHAQQQGPEHNERFQMIAVHVVGVRKGWHSHAGPGSGPVTLLMAMKCTGRRVSR
jgi:hypothetical protein